MNKEQQKISQELFPLWDLLSENCYLAAAVDEREGDEFILPIVEFLKFFSNKINVDMLVTVKRWRALTKMYNKALDQLEKETIERDLGECTGCGLCSKGEA